MVYSGSRIYGPYQAKDGRIRVIILFPDGNRTTVSYPKYLVETMLNRYLKDNETIDHIDNNPLNNDPNNLRIVDRESHCRDEAPTRIPMTFICPECGNEFTLERKRLGNAVANNNKNRAGPFCSRSCAGTYGAKVQNNYSEKIPVIKIQIKKVIPKDSKKLSLLSETVAVEAAKTGNP